MTNETNMNTSNEVVAPINPEVVEAATVAVEEVAKNEHFTGEETANFGEATAPVEAAE